jgi:hypothetical protein
LYVSQKEAIFSPEKVRVIVPVEVTVSALALMILVTLPLIVSVIPSTVSAELNEPFHVPFT